MKIDFEYNDYLLAWNLLYGASISPKIHEFKQKLWNNYKKQYTNSQKDKDEMLLDHKNYIPDDDTLYNLVFQADYFEKVKEETEIYREQVIKNWDANKKQITKILKEDLRIPLDDKYTILVLHPKMDQLLNSSKSKTMAWGFRNDIENPVVAMTNLVYAVVSLELKNYNREYKEIVQAVVELAVHNELYTRMTGKSNQLDGDKSLQFLKRKIYPYWLMYLGCDKEDMIEYMMRDQMAFDIDKYIVETKLRKVDIYEFIKFCITNQKHILRIGNLDLI